MYTRDSLHNAAGRVSSTVIRGNLSTKAASADTVTVFLSHSHADKYTTAVEDTRALLADQGVRLYIDSDDAEMPSQTSPETAKLLKERIGQFRKFILLATVNSLRSVWCGWELGIADSMINTRNIIIWPVSELPWSPPNNEYLGIYPRVEESNDGKPGVFEPGKSEGITLASWLRRM